ncbi:DNA alkylation repair protein [Muriicola soli]|uniref:DNA alkylation repair protein n=2 Tax=Muriicola soli TaxID=2507538 RepID=A0A411ED44_9FLAO|nr:DNA alkylation repair protein [Muriicola soli]
MRDQFEFYGLKSPVRRDIQKELFRKHLPPLRSDIKELVIKLWKLPERENHYMAQELAKKKLKVVAKEDYLLFENLITHKSWWDTVDFIAANLVGNYFKAFPEQRTEITSKWLGTGNIWLQRSVLLFQLKYKAEVDTEFLADTIHYLTGSKEFFINKAIGWILREYSKTNPIWVSQFVEATQLHSLSKREALRLIK